MPPDADNRIAVAQQPRVSRVIGQVPVTAINNADNARASAVRNLQQQRAIALAQVFRTHRNKIRGKLYFAIFEIHAFVEVDDASIAGIRNGDRKIDAADNAFVGSGAAEDLAVEHVAARRDIDANNFSVERGSEAEHPNQERRYS